jgi:hypothetical protein
VIECQESWPTLTIVQCATASEFHCDYINDIHFLYIYGVQHSMRPRRHPVVHGNEHEMLINENAVII